MEKVWVLFHNNGEDCVLLGIFSSEEKANERLEDAVTIKRTNAYGEYSVYSRFDLWTEEWEVDKWTTT